MIYDVESLIHVKHSHSEARIGYYQGWRSWIVWDIMYVYDGVLIKKIWIMRFDPFMSSVWGRPFTIGSHYPANKKTEIYKQESDKWETLQDFPFAKINIEQYGISSTQS